MSTDQSDTPRRKGFIPLGPFSLGFRNLSINLATGETTGHPVAAIDVSTWWARIALEHLKACRTFNTSMLEAELQDNFPDVSAALREEVSHGMQTIVAAAIALDGFYERLIKHAPIPVEVKRSWKRNRTAKDRRMFEVFKSVFDIPPINLSRVDEMLAQVKRFRDWAIHPDAEGKALQAHPEIP